MIIKIKFLTVASLVIVLGLYGIGYAESEIPLTFKSEFPVFNERIYSSHSSTFAHSTHSMEYKIACVQCHHTLEPGAIAVDETCMDCHGRKAIGDDQRFRRIPEEERARTYLMGLHDMCIECHKDKNVPVFSHFLGAKNRDFRAPCLTGTSFSGYVFDIHFRFPLLKEGSGRFC